jgi:hypothetical protein
VAAGGVAAVPHLLSAHTAADLARAISILEMEVRDARKYLAHARAATRSIRGYSTSGAVWPSLWPLETTSTIPIPEAIDKHLRRPGLLGMEERWRPFNNPPDEDALKRAPAWLDLARTANQTPTPRDARSAVRNGAVPPNGCCEPTPRRGPLHPRARTGGCGHLAETAGSHLAAPLRHHLLATVAWTVGLPRLSPSRPTGDPSHLHPLLTLLLCPCLHRSVSLRDPLPCLP